MQNCYYKVGLKPYRGYFVSVWGFFSICRVKYKSKLGHRQVKEYFPADLQGFAHSSLSTEPSADPAQQEQTTVVRYKQEDSVIYFL